MAGKKHLENVEFLIAKQSYLKRFDQLFIDLQNFSTNGYFKETIRNFRYCIKPDEAQNDSRLPYLSYKMTCSRANKDECLLCVLSVAVQRFWDFYTSKTGQGAGIDVILTKLEECAKNGKKVYRIAGKFPKFYLEKKEVMRNVQ